MTTTDETRCIAQPQVCDLVDHRGNHGAEFLHAIDELQRRIGQDLHDGVEQELVGLGLISEALLKQLMCESGSISEESIRSYQEMAKAIVEGFSRAHGELRSISRGLVPGVGLSKKLPEAIEALAKRTDQIHGIACSFHCVGSTPCLSDPIALQLYRIAQESVCNALKHSGATRILIAIEANQGCTKLQVADNGNGFHHQQTHSGLGLQSMQYRAELIGAKIQIRTSICGGTVVCCALDGAKDA